MKGASLPLFREAAFPRGGRSVIPCGWYPEQCWPSLGVQDLSPVKAETVKTEKANLGQPHTGLNTAWGSEKSQSWDLPAAGSAFREAPSLLELCAV